MDISRRDFLKNVSFAALGCCTLSLLKLPIDKSINHKTADCRKYPIPKEGYYITSVHIDNQGNAFYSVIGSDNWVYRLQECVEEVVHPMSYDWTYAANKVCPFMSCNHVENIFNIIKDTKTYNYYYICITYCRGDDSLPIQTSVYYHA